MPHLKGSLGFLENQRQRNNERLVQGLVRLGLELEAERKIRTEAFPGNVSKLINCLFEPEKEKERSCKNRGGDRKRKNLEGRRKKVEKMTKKSERCMKKVQV